MSRAVGESPGVRLLYHLIVPAAIILMVSAFLFFLLDVRSVFLGGGSRLKQVGLCFVVATVLIERYGRSHRDEEGRRGLYTGCLGLATMLAMVSLTPKVGGAAMGLLISGFVIVATWRFATRLTAALSPERKTASHSQPDRLFGVQRLELEAWRKTQGGAYREPATVDTTSSVDAHGNPARSVVRLGLLALVLFALSEPLLLAGPPIAGQRALADMVIFLLAGGVVMSAGASAGFLRRVRQAGGRPRAGVALWRLASALTLATVLLASALALPGLRYQGSGDLSPRTQAGRGGGRDSSPARIEQGEQGGSKGSAKARTQGASGAGSPALTMLSNMTAVGRILLILLVVGTILLFVFVALRQRRHLRTALRAVWNRGRALWSALLRGLRRRPPPPPSTRDPLADLESLVGLPPRDAVLAAYDRLLAFLEKLGHGRASGQSPAELLATLPPRLRRLRPAAEAMTDLYLQAAYSGNAVSSDARERALNALWSLRGEVRSTEPSARR